MQTRPAPDPDAATAVLHVEVETDPAGGAVVRWSLAAPGAVDIAVGPGPDRVDHRHHTTVPAGRTTLHLERRELDPARRCFVSVAPHGSGPAVVAGERRVGFEGIQNFRDLGGYRTRSGATVRWGRVFRADALHGLTRTDLERYRRLGMRAVYDLRGDTERAERPNPVPSHQVTVVGRPDGAGEAPAPGPTPASAADGERILRDLYLGLLEHSADRIGVLLRAFSAEARLPAVFHCHAGKDRTGVVAAVLLEALGVARRDVLDDYELTARYRLRSHQEGSYQRLVASGLAPEAAAGVLTTPRWAMQQALDALDEHHGGVEAYLTGPAGLRRAELDALRDVLLEGPG